ncbi:BDH1 isoform 14, partial [Pongo abelii]
MLATRLSRPLSRLPGKTLSACDRENGARRPLLLGSTYFIPIGHRTYAGAV